MIDVSVLPAFVAVILLFLVPPGPDMAYMLAVGLESGRLAAVKAILGIGTGMVVYATLVVVGVGRLTGAYPLLLDVVKVLGAAYLLWLAVVTVRHARRGADGPGEAPTGRPYLRGLVVSLTNPKVILFFLAVLPQFLGTATNTERQLAMLGAVNVAMEVLLYGAVSAGLFHARFEKSRRAGVVLKYVAAGVYALLAVVVVLETIVGFIGR